MHDFWKEGTSEAIPQVPSCIRNFAASGAAVARLCSRFRLTTGIASVREVGASHRSKYLTVSHILVRGETNSGAVGED